MAHLAAGVDGFNEGAAAAGLTLPTCLGVTVLTSEPADAAALAQRVAIADEAGCGGLVCAAGDLAEVARLAPDLLTVVPGIRPAGVAADDQARPATPSEAIVAGAHVLGDRSRRHPRPPTRWPPPSPSPPSSPPPSDSPCPARTHPPPPQMVQFVTLMRDVVNHLEQDSPQLVQYVTPTL